MSDVNIKKFSGLDFNPDKYVKEISEVCIGGQELQSHRSKVQTIAEETSGALKKNVYQNYMQFIETAKEFSHLESEMYQLFHLLTEQRSLLAVLSQTPAAALDNSSVEEKEEFKEDKREKLLTAITEKVEGCMSLLDVPNRVLLYEGDLLELDPLENTPLHRVHAYLLTDILLIATWISNRRGPIRYKFQTQYELGSLAVVNVRDLGNIRHAFKLLTFPDSRVFQCTNNQTKREWLDNFEGAKKAQIAQEQQKRDTISNINELKSPVRTESIDSSNNPFGISEDGDGEHSLIEEMPDWVMEVPEDLDVLIVQRHFEDAHELIEKTREYFDKCSHNHSSSAHQEIRRKVEQRVTALINVLTSELAVNPDKSLQGGLRAARRSVRLLNLLGRSTQACDLFLQLCSSILKAQMKRVKREGAAVIYVKRLSRIFFFNLTEMIKEFELRAFPKSPTISSVFVVWTSNELIHFTNHLVKQVFVPQSSLSTLAECVTLVRDQCQSLRDLGVDVCFQLEGQLSSPIKRSLLDTRDKLVDSVKIRSAEDNWRPYNLNTKQTLESLNNEFLDHGFPGIKEFVTGEWWIELTSNTISFIKVFISLLEDGQRLASIDLMHTLDIVLNDVFTAQLKHVIASLNSDRHKAQKQLIVKNGSYLIECLKVACARLSIQSGSRLNKLLHSDFASVLSQNKNTIVSNVTDYI